jgi:hypothetical protein
MVMVEVPEPAAMDTGPKFTVTPVGCPLADKTTAELKPFDGVTVITVVE